MTSVDPSGACSQSRGQLPVNFSSEGVDFVTVASISYIGWKRGEDYPDTALNYRKGQGKTGTFKIAPRRSRSLAHGTPDLDTFAAPFGVAGEKPEIGVERTRAYQNDPSTIPTLRSRCSNSRVLKKSK